MARGDWPGPGRDGGLDRVHPLHEVVKVDHYIPGCPPSADAIWKFLTDLIEGRTPRLGHGLISYD